MATNRHDTLDPALLRPGRLDRKIEFPLPDRRQKRLIFQGTPAMCYVRCAIMMLLLLLCGCCCSFALLLVPPPSCYGCQPQIVFPPVVCTSKMNLSDEIDLEYYVQLPEKVLR